MPARHTFCAVLVVLFGVGCGSARSRAIATAREIGINELRNDLILTVSVEGKQREIPQTAWPDSVRRFHPLAIQRHMGGVLIVTSRVGREQEGLLVMLDSKDNPGSGGSGVNYDRIRDGVFWCVEKVRDAYIPPEQRTNQSKQSLRPDHALLRTAAGRRGCNRRISQGWAVRSGP